MKIILLITSCILAGAAWSLPPSQGTRADVELLQQRPTQVRNNNEQQSSLQSEFLYDDLTQQNVDTQNTQQLENFNQQQIQTHDNSNFYNQQQKQNQDNRYFYNQQQNSNNDYYNQQQTLNQQHNFNQQRNQNNDYYNQQQTLNQQHNFNQQQNQSQSNFYNQQHNSTQENNFFYNQRRNQSQNNDNYYNQQHNQNQNNVFHQQNTQNQDNLHVYSQRGDLGEKKNHSLGLNFERGVCYTEVPTASLVKNPGNQIPAGNGSRPELSRIRICCHGYIRNIHNFRLCDPVCKTECINAICTAPETCTCYPDHVRNLGGVCVATCPIGCQNGKCDGGECMCNEGYTLDRNGEFCVPVCKDSCGPLGNCTAPNTCECSKGYESIGGSCKAHCDHCENGDCLEPNKCKCHQGYNANDKGECVPHCPQGCGTSGHCSAPNICSCPKGFHFEQQTKQCKPVCTTPCVHGECVAPNECKCNQGYTKRDSEECSPVCSPECGPNGRCSAPNVCTCSQGFEFDQSTRQCRAQCSRPCLNGDCVGPNECKCHAGYTKSEYGECIPECPGGCGPQGQCVSPNTCVCAPGFQLDKDTKRCKSQNPGGLSAGSLTTGTCIDQCLNGACNDGVCTCNPGYVIDSIEQNRCIPHCPGGCPNGVCSSPNFCICNMGYFKDRSTKGRPVCVKRARRSIAEELIFELPDE